MKNYTIIFIKEVFTKGGVYKTTKFSISQKSNILKNKVLKQEDKGITEPKVQSSSRDPSCKIKVIFREKPQYNGGPTRRSWTISTSFTKFTK
jgi:hypothetical protein